MEAMHGTIKKLLEKGDEESLEYVCRLFKTVGKHLEEKGSKTQEKNVMDSYFDSMQKIVDEYSRIVSLLKEVIDLRKNNWIPIDANNFTNVDPSIGETKQTETTKDVKQDQRSPLNSNEKKQYDRNFLLQWQFQPISLCTPSDLPNLDEIKNKPHSTINRRSQTGGRGEKKPKFMRLPTDQNIKLHESENAWKLSHKTERNAVEDTKEQDLFRRIRSILNKLTPENFQALFEQMKELPINTESKLDETVNLIFEKAIKEPMFSVLYANLCRNITLKVPLEDGQGYANFRKLLLTKCQKEFEQDKNNEKKRKERIKAIKAVQEDEEKRKELQMEFDEEEKKIRMRQLGNIKFIGELFKLNMLIEPIMHECIKKLLTQGDEESLECLCHLLKTIGKELDEKGSKTRETSMDAYFVSMQKIVDKRLTSSRVRFMLQDVIDLKKNNWIPRRDENNPKTIVQIHKEEEEARQALQNISYSKRPADDRRKKLYGVIRENEGVLKQIFNSLYDDDVITEETFKLWVNSKDPADQEVQGVVLRSVIGLFTCLREAEW